jgi:hypothetical protein
VTADELLNGFEGVARGHVNSQVSPALLPGQAPKAMCSVEQLRSQQVRDVNAVVLLLIPGGLDKRIDWVPDE